MQCYCGVLMRRGFYYASVTQNKLAHQELEHVDYLSIIEDKRMLVLLYSLNLSHGGFSIIFYG